MQIRLVLKQDGHSAVKVGGDVCTLQTPSAQQSGIKILLPEPVQIETGYSYSLLIDFDAKKSIVQQGNGGCLLKPVLKIKSFTRVPSDEVDDNGGTTAPGDDLLDGGEPGNDGDGGFFDGWDPSDPSTWPPGVTEEDIRQWL